MRNHIFLNITLKFQLHTHYTLEVIAENVNIFGLDSYCVDPTIEMSFQSFISQKLGEILTFGEFLKRIFHFLFFFFFFSFAMIYHVY